MASTTTPTKPAPTTVKTPRTQTKTGAPGLHATVDRKALTELLGEISRTASAKSTLPILSNFRVEAEGEHVSFSATNLSRQVSARLNATVSAPGALTLNAHALADWIKIQDQATSVSFQPAETSSKCLVSCGRASIKLPYIPADDWPTLGSAFADAQKTEFSLGGQELREAIRLVSICAAPDDTRPILHGVLLELSDTGKQIVFAAADGFRLAVRTLDFDSPVSASSLKVVVPVDSLDELASLIDDEDGPVHISLDATAHFVQFETPVYTLLTNTIEGAFPDYQRIIPKQFGTVVQASRQPLLRGTRAALVVASDRAVRFTRSDTDTGDGTLVITSTAQEGEALDQASVTFADQAGGTPVATIALNGKYLAEMLRAMPTDTVQWQMAGSGHPLLIRPVGSNGYYQVLMPMSVPPNNPT